MVASSGESASYEPLSLDASVPPITLEACPTDETKARKRAAAFFCLGLLNNTSYVIMLAAAKSLSEGGTGLVYIANILPGISVKLSAPYWFDRVTYQSRVSIAAACMAMAFFITGYSERRLQYPHNSDSLTYLPFVGVALVSLQCGLGEATLLAAAGKCDSLCINSQGAKGRCLTAWSSGTGAAGLTGYLWTVAGTHWLDFGVAWTILAALILAVMYGLIYITVLGDIDDEKRLTSYALSQDIELTNDLLEADAIERSSACSERESIQTSQTSLITRGISIEEMRATDNLSDSRQPIETNEFETIRPFHFILSLWPYTVPLFLVYAAEYACQAGVWTAMGFPIEDATKRNQFYQTSNWLYQAGVFVSRSSGTFLTLSPTTLWVLPFLQVLNLLFFSVTALQSPQTSWLYSQPLLYITSIWTGILGGAVYVHGYKRILVDFQGTFLTEMALATTSVAEGIGILMADILGLFLQGCLYQVHHLDNALVHCPLKGFRLRA
ncbi:battenin [Fistulifera solaris]|uniref:Battenin n=1 Tax=Fistulifera solaris TaxID=1519565 RepID=A0A1Z5JI24_FISSO|nr:battenin [Fistulifera solaris]|eukprot:GAX13586.1 battenin [Fistulifera solaris]